MLKYSECIYHDFRLQIVDETPSSFIVNNGDGEAVSEDNRINIQFMLIKDALGFQTIDRATYQKEINKLDDNLALNAMKLIFHDGWFLRVIEENAEQYLVVISQNQHTETKWLSKSDTEDLQPYVTYWKRELKK